MSCLLAIILLASAADSLSAAKSALEQGFPLVAIKKLQSSSVGEKDAESVLVLARAYLEDGQPAEAIRLLRSQNPGPTRDFWLAQSLAASGSWQEALQKYQSCGADRSLVEASILGQARMLRNLGRAGEALTTLAAAGDWPSGTWRNLAALERAETFLDLQQSADARRELEGFVPASREEKSLRDYALARALSMAGDDAGALQLFDKVVPVDSRMAIGVVIGKAQSLVHSGQLPAAENLLEDFLSKNPGLQGLGSVFSVLDTVYAAQPAPSSSELKRWVNDDDSSPRKSLAGYYLARFEGRQGREDRVEKLLADVVADSGNDPSLEPAALDLAEIRLKHGRPGDALALLPPKGQSSRADFLRGLALAAMGDPSSASEYFLSAASDGSLAEAALSNAAVCDFLSGAKKSTGFNLLSERFPESPKLRSLLLKKGYELAKRGDKGALQVFEDLSKADDPRLAGAANLAIAEWNYDHEDRSAARERLLRVSTASREEDQSKADALMVFLADDGKSDDAAIASATRFLSTHPGTPSEPEVMMKLGELLYRKGDFAGARVQLESLARKYPGTAMEYPALFLAAQSASRLQTPAAMNDATLLFEEVASSDSPLALRARFEQAVLQNVLGKPKEAVVILDKIIASNGGQDIKSAARIEKGKTLYGLGSGDPKSYFDAIDVWTEVATDPATSPGWKNQALARIGSAYEKLGDTDAAVASYYDVIRDSKLAPQTFFWYYKAGFAAARLLESAKRWDQAIKVYEMIAAAGGPRSEEATSRINKIRLENFLWDDSAGS